MTNELLPTDLRRLWSPWRMKYVGGGAAEDGCIFCNRLDAGDDVTSLILHRGQRTFAMMNLYPYNTGHLMIVPNAHVATPEEADPEAMAELATTLQPILRALRRVLSPAGFNVGLNVGEVAGAGVAAHLHMHVVPRWTGDANFMPILASTMVVPELIPVTYAKLRAEIQRETSAASQTEPVTLVVLTKDGERVLALKGVSTLTLPAVTPQPSEAVWRAGSRLLTERGLDTALVGWAGAAEAGNSPPALTFEAEAESPPPAAGMAWIPTEQALTTLPADERALVSAARPRLAPTVIAPPGQAL